jgi:transposase
MGQELLSGSYIQADETTVGVQMHDGRGKNHQAYLWQYSRPGGAVMFDFRMGREREGPKQFLGNFEGILQSEATELMIISETRAWCTPRAWHMPGESSSMQ